MSTINPSPPSGCTVLKDEIAHWGARFKCLIWIQLGVSCKTTHRDLFLSLPNSFGGVL